jgi:beta-glucosidase
VLFGAYSPSGRLPASFPRRSGQQPYYYAHKRTGRPNPEGKLEPYKARFRDITNTALYPFGHGLTYGKIEYSDFTLSARSMGMNGEITVTARITNRGRRTAEEVVQLYIHDRVASITRPVRELKAFRKVKLAPGQSEVVRFALRPANLQFYGVNNRPVVEPGTFDVWIAPSAEAEGVRGSFDLTALAGSASGLLSRRAPRPSGLSSIATQDKARKSIGTRTMVARMPLSVSVLCCTFAT